ncbi:hypothetical protein Anapl_02380 [Anas platyrhynchos]|uniref:Uncharacterized protein n=1 Tax=Anas platyrhynchos TaxID=8839 RepID=R0JXR2_ANAPL|nr:hypothetical protein Anapl_02380 [Anas platyrhynchos]
MDEASCISLIGWEGVCHQLLIQVASISSSKRTQPDKDRCTSDYSPRQEMGHKHKQPQKQQAVNVRCNRGPILKHLCRGSFPVPCARLQTEAVRVTATGGADFPSGSTLSALLSESVEGGSNFSKAQANTSIACNGDSTEYPVLKQEDRQQSLSFKVLGRSRLLSFIPAAKEGNLSTSATSSPNLWAGKYLCLLQSHLPTEELKSVEQLPKTAKYRTLSSSSSRYPTAKIDSCHSSRPSETKVISLDEVCGEEHN